MRTFLLSILTCWLAGFGPPSLADTLRVPGDFSTIQEALDTAGPGATSDPALVARGRSGPAVDLGADERGLGEIADGFESVDTSSWSATGG